MTISACDVNSGPAPGTVLGEQKLQVTELAPDLAVTGLHQLGGAGTCATPSMPMPCCADWSPTTPRGPSV